MRKKLILCFSILALLPSTLASAMPTKTILCNSGNIVGNPSLKIEADQNQLNVQKWRTIGYSHTEGRWHHLALRSYEEGLCENCLTLNWDFVSFRGADNPEVRVEVKYIIQQDSSGLIAHEWRKAEDDNSWWRNGSAERPDRCLVFSESSNL